MLLFGTGLVFARYAGGLFKAYREPVIVSLVGREGSSTKETGRRKKQVPYPVPVKPELEPSQQLPDTSSDKAYQSKESEARGHEIAGAAKAEAGNSLEREQAAGSESGTVSSEQWAVIVSSIERAKSYPRLARERGIEGVVRLRFRLKPQGEVERVEIIKSSGYDILDGASVRTLYRAGPMPYVRGWVEVPMAYVLK
jgi:protein TonB